MGSIDLPTPENTKEIPETSFIGHYGNVNSWYIVILTIISLNGEVKNFQYHTEIQSVAVGEDTFQTSILSMLMDLKTLVVCD